MTNVESAWEHRQQPQNTASIEWTFQQAFGSGSRQLSIDRGGEIVTAGVTCKHVFQVKSGLAIRQRPLRDGGRAILDLYFPDDLIELDSLFFAPRSTLSSR
jgi:CRP-like cAMP-binding protein